MSATPVASAEPSAPVVTQIPGTLGSVAVGSGPCALETAPDGRAYVSLYSAHSVVRIDPATGAVTQLATLDGTPCGVAFAGGSVWVGVLGTHQLVRLDPDSGAVQETIALKGDPWDVQPGGGYVWVADRGIPGVIGYDETTGDPGPSVTTGYDPTGLAYLDGHLWVTLQGPHKLIRLDAAGDAAEVTTDVGSQPTWFADGDGTLWITDNAGTVHRIDPTTGKSIADIDLGGSPRDPVFAFGALWVANGADGVLSRISPDTNAVSGTLQLKPGIWTVEQVRERAVGRRLRRTGDLPRRPRQRRMMTQAAQRSGVPRPRISLFLAATLVLAGCAPAQPASSGGSPSAEAQSPSGAASISPASASGSEQPGMDTTLDALASAQPASQAYRAFLRQSSMEAGIYQLAAGAADSQESHQRDELYVILAGSASLEVDGTEQAVTPGSIVFVRAGVQHRFTAIASALRVLVVFANAATNPADPAWQLDRRNDLAAAATPARNVWSPFLRTSTMTAGLYLLPASVGGDHPQTHATDELNLMFAGNAEFVVDGGTPVAIGPGSVMSVNAGHQHDFRCPRR